MILILLTAFLDILGLSLFLPLFPSIIEGFWVNPSWTGYTQAIYAIGMFVGGLFFGKLSDRYGRKKMLSYTSVLNLSSYIILFYSLSQIELWGNLEATVGEFWPIALWSLDWIFGGFTPFFLIFLVSRFIGGLGGAGFWVIQAYISDISSREDKAKRMGMMGAAFGFAFLIGPAIGGILASYTSIHTVIGLCIAVVLINVLSIWIFLQEPKKHKQEPWVELQNFHFSRIVIILLFLSFGATLGFSAIQSMSTQFYTDRFAFSPREIGYSMAMVGLISIIYQGGLVSHVRKKLSEIQMIQLALLLLTVWFIGFSYNTSPIYLFFWLIFFPLGMGSFNPGIGSMLSNKAGKEVGKVMGYNTSIQSVGQIFWPVLAGSLYLVPGSALPFFASAGIFWILFVVSFFLSE